MQPELVSETDQGLLASASALAHRLRLPTTFVKFIIVGAVAYLINQFCLYLFYDSPVFWFLPAKETKVDLGLLSHPDIRLLIASVLAVETAIIFQFQSHERWTFRHRQRKGWIGQRFLKFNLSASLSPVIVVVTVNTLTPIFGISPYISNTIGVLAGFIWNWTLNTLVIWPRREEGQAA